MHDKTQEIRESVADRFQQLADTDTFFRLHHAPLIGELIAHSKPGWEVARATTALVLTDSTDGYWARTAKTVRGYDVATEGAAKDPEADHLTIDSIMSGLIQRESIRDNRSVAVRIAQLQFRSQTRNQRMDENRQIIARHPEIDQRELRASSLNKAKMVFQVIGGVALTSPLAERSLGSHLGLGIMQFGTWLGEIGERQFRGKVQQLIAQHNVTTTTTPKPNHLKDRR